MQRPLKLGLIGLTLNHSRSHKIHKAGLAYLQIEGDYVNYEIDKKNFADKIKSLLINVDGLNVTIPYKETMLKYLNDRDELVERIGATNTLKISGHYIKGYNTDYYGFTESLKEHDLQDACVSILGAGGVSRAVLVALDDLGVEQIYVHVRNPNKVDGNLPKLNKAKLDIKLMNDEENFEDSNLLINSTPIGQGRLADSTPITRVQLDGLKDNTLVYDLVYEDTKLLQTAKSRGLTTINGSTMLIMQAVQSLSIWTGCQIDKKLVNLMSSEFYSCV